MHNSEILIDQIHGTKQYDDRVHVLLVRPGYYQYLSGLNQIVNEPGTSISVVVHTLDQDQEVPC